MTLVHMKAACIAFFHISAFVFPLLFLSLASTAILRCRFLFLQSGQAPEEQRVFLMVAVKPLIRTEGWRGVGWINRNQSRQHK